VFVSRWKRHADLTLADHLDRYLATAVKFAVHKEYYRKKKRQASLLERLSFEEEHQIEDFINARFLQQYINGILEQLPEKCRLVYRYSREAD
jgi:hypothetical protein